MIDLNRMRCDFLLFLRRLLDFTPPSEAILFGRKDPLLDELNREWEGEEPRYFDLTCARREDGTTIHGGLSVLPLWVQRWRS